MHTAKVYYIEGYIKSNFLFLQTCLKSRFHHKNKLKSNRICQMIPGSRHWVLIWGLYGTSQNLLVSLSHVGLYDGIFIIGF